MGGFFSGSFLGGGGLFAGCLGGPGAGWGFLTGPPSAESTSSFTSDFFRSVSSSLTFFTSLATGGGGDVSCCSLRFFGCGGRPVSPLAAGGLVGLTGEVTVATAAAAVVVVVVVVLGGGGPGLLGCGLLGAERGGGLAGPGVGPEPEAEPGGETG